MKAIEILKESLSTNLSIAQGYNKKATMYLSVDDIKQAQQYKDEADDFIKRADRCQEAINELQLLLTINNN